ncbi:glycosyltransferase family 2 protein [Nocardioides flavescens]|uniref:Glycosyltransferase n=1 Tax=Nocardioides flavescens TaxID=2691959 RepID=A0A6L7F124_9ACTN|nr:glycosyltransferase [Nocardioides flavescens]MXG89962.1 glycosyltransferase [Nocardioides flavescens]
MTDLDVMLITHTRAAYTALSLPRLLETCPEGSRVWVWHNGTDREVLDVIAAHEDHPRLHRVHRSEENVGLRPAMNWLWTEARGTYLSKVDDDSLMEPGWVEHLTRALSASPTFGVLGSWRFLPEDWDEELARPKVETMHGVTLLRNHWVQGSGHMFRRSLVDEVGTLQPGQSFPSWCIRVAQRGYVNGWPMPMVREEHMDDPRHPLTAFRNEAAYQEARPLSALHTGATTLAEWLEQTKQDARSVQAASLDLRRFSGWRRKLTHGRRRLRKALTGKNAWT